MTHKRLSCKKKNQPIPLGNPVVLKIKIRITNSPCVRVAWWWIFDIIRKYTGNFSIFLQRNTCHYHTCAELLIHTPVQHLIIIETAMTLSYHKSIHLCTCKIWDNFLVFLQICTDHACSKGATFLLIVNPFRDFLFC